MTKSYIVGLDIGNTSVGWAVIDKNNFKVIRKGNKKLWGVRLFDEATTAAKRRIARSSRRRLQRRKIRIKYLQKEFDKEINLVDNKFFTKLKESAFNEVDINNKTIKTSNEELKKINEYYRKYPTIYHLRYDLIHNNKKKDIRLVYLALHHIIKYRGNFNNPSNMSINELNITKQLEKCFSSIDDLLNNEKFCSDNISMLDYNKLEEFLLIDNKKDRKIKITNMLDIYFSKNFVSEFCKLISGDIFSITKLFDLDLEEDLKITFSGNTYEDKITEYEVYLNNELEVIDNFRELHDMIYLKKIFKNAENPELSNLMIEKYKKHCDDLYLLKKAFRQDRVLYNKLFRSNDKYCLYDNYVHNKIDYNSFRNDLNKLILELNKKLGKTIIKEINVDDFLPRISSTDNGKFPYHLNKKELISIIENQGVYYPFLLNKTNDGEYRLVKLLEFKIPYYVGPLNNTTSIKDIKSPFAWLTKIDKGVNITPYNLHEVVDFNKTAEDFITRMISNCTYILNEKAMPSNSILYSTFKVLNELKQIKVNGIKLSVDMQNKIYEELFLNIQGSVTDKKFKTYLMTTGEYDMYNELIVTGYSALNKFANNMKSYVDFFGLDGIFKNTKYNIDNAEEIISWITIFEDKNILLSKLKEKYSDLSEDRVKKILVLKYRGWSNLSLKLLTTKYYEGKSILDLMKETNENFMQIIFNKKYNFQKMIDEFNKIDVNNRINYELVSNLVTSPSIKRGIYQSLKVIEEITKYMGYAPDSVSIEMARSNEIKKRTVDKKKYIEQIYEKNKSVIDNYTFLKNQLKKIDNITNEKLFLYFVQEGKSLYSKTPLDINSLGSYEVDHIIPRTLIKDDSIQNKALVLHEENQSKAANFVLPSNYRNNNMQKWWEHLKKIGLMSNKKFNNLCRDRYSDSDVEGFINRQLVETRQITKHVANIIANYYPNTKVIYLHATLSSNYRDKNELYKFRNINDYHHAHDAYLAGVLGEYKNTYLKQNIDFNKLKEFNYNLFNTKKYKDLKYGYVINSLDNTVNSSFINGNFDVDIFNKTVINTMYQNDIIVSKKTEIRTGKFYDENLSKKGTKGAKLKKDLDINMYGSYSGVNPAYASLVRYKVNTKEKQRLIGIPIYIDAQSKNNNLIKLYYIKELLNLKNINDVEIVKDKIPFYTLLNWNKQICYLVGATDKVEVCNAKEFKIDKQNMLKWKYTLNKLLNKKDMNIDDDKYENDLEEIIIYIIDKISTEYFLYNSLIDTIKVMFKYNNVKLLSVSDKEIIVLEMFKLLQCNSVTANLKALDSDYSSAFGRKKGCNIEHAKIINTSTTGIWEYTNEF